MRKFVQVRVLPVVVGCLMFLGVGDAFAEGLNVYGKVESMTWKEHDNGTRLVKESGTIYGIGATYVNDAKKTIGIKTRVELFGGTIDYDGHVQNILTGELIRHGTDTKYLGVKLEGDVGYRFSVTNNFRIEPFAGIGYRGWRRDIKDSYVPALDAIAHGPDEVYHTIHGRLGARGTYKIADKTNVFVEGGAKLPIWNRQSVDVFGYGVTLKPGKRASAFAEVGVRHKLLKASLYYEGIRFGKSNEVEVMTELGALRVHQPKSKADMFGVTVGIVF